jgi:hypothetical protein
MVVSMQAMTILDLGTNGANIVSRRMDKWHTTQVLGFLRAFELAAFIYGALAGTFLELLPDSCRQDCVNRGMDKAR